MSCSGRKALFCLVLTAACRDQQPPKRNDDETLAQRVFPPPPGVVRAVPPHRIQPDGIGPYALGADLQDILEILPDGPRVELLQIERLAAYRLVRVAQDSILVGIGPRGRVSFVAAFDPEIAKTEAGLGVGSDIAELRKALGPERELAGARDPRIVELEQLPNARVVVDQGKAIAIVVGLMPEGEGQDLGSADALSGGGSPRPVSVPAGTGAGRPARRVPALSAEAASGDGACSAARAAEPFADQPLASVARIDETAEMTAHYGCFTGPTPEVVIASGEQLVLVVGEPGHLRRATALSAPGLLFASAVDLDGDGRQELVAVSEKRTSDLLAARVEVLRGENGRLVGAGADQVYKVTSAAAAPVGAKLKDIDLLIEATAGSEELEVTGLYLHRVGGVVRSVAPLLPKSVPLRSRRRSDGGPASASSPAVPTAASRGAGGARGLRPANPDRKRETDRQ